MTLKRSRMPEAGALTRPSQVTCLPGDVEGAGLPGNAEGHHHVAGSPGAPGESCASPHPSDEHPDHTPEASLPRPPGGHPALLPVSSAPLAQVPDSHSTLVTFVLTCWQIL